MATLGAKPVIRLNRALAFRTIRHGSVSLCNLGVARHSHGLDRAMLNLKIDLNTEQIRMLDERRDAVAILEANRFSPAISIAIDAIARVLHRLKILQLCPD